MYNSSASDSEYENMGTAFLQGTVMLRFFKRQEVGDKVLLLLLFSLNFI